MIFKRKETVRKWSGTSHRMNSHGLVKEINERESGGESHDQDYAPPVAKKCQEIVVSYCGA